MSIHTSKKYALFLMTVSMGIEQNLVYGLLTHNSWVVHRTYQNILPHLSNKRRLSSRSFALSHNRNNENDDYNIDDDIPLSESITHARQRLEEMMSIPQEKQQAHQPSFQQLQHQSTTPPLRTVAYLTHQINSINTPGNTNPPPPPFTTIARERRNMELEILDSLSTSDDAINDLWKLWFTERGSDAAKLLLRAEELSSRVLRALGRQSATGLGSTSDLAESCEDYAQEAEDILWDLIEEYGVHWAEPVNRLATLMYMRGRLEESKALCEVVLNVKPWHIGALNGMVMVCISMNDVGGARGWAEKRLPTLVMSGESNDVVYSRRRSWVKRACHDARHRYNLAAKYETNLEEDEARFHHMRKKLQKIVEVNESCKVHKVTNDKLCGGSFEGVWQ